MTYRIVSNNFQIVETDNDILILPISSELIENAKVFSTNNEIAKMVLLGIDNGVSVDELIKEIQNIYDANPDIIKADVMSFLDSLLANKIVECIEQTC